ncbi:MAG: class II fructose-bisphosphate aldolase [Patescibacteria group bacterium]|nr:class II fructose-bisphosphate aldolase [Patescibacteria group bacterium]
MSIADFSKENNPHVRVLEGGYTLSNLKTLLKVADEHKFGIPACNARSKWIINAILDAAWEENAPIILEIAESEAIYCDMAPAKLSDLVHEGVNARIKKHGYSVPVCLHHDHIQKDVDGCIQASIDAGFSSVEVDLSKLSLEENAAKCKEVSEKIHPLGMSLEVEDGEIGNAAALADPDVENTISQYYTKTEEAKKLCEITTPEAIAFFVGNGHGNYLKEPIIGFDRIKEICDAVRPLKVYGVMHGGSGLSPEVFNKCIESGARKFNYATSISDIWFKHFPQELLDTIDAKAKEMERPRRKVLYLFQDEIEKINHSEAEKEMKEHLKMMFRDAFKSAGKADLYG